MIQRTKLQGYFGSVCKKLYELNMLNLAIMSKSIIPHSKAYPCIQNVIIWLFQVKGMENTSMPVLEKNIQMQYLNTAMVYFGYIANQVCQYCLGRKYVKVQVKDSNSSVL